MNTGKSQPGPPGAGVVADLRPGVREPGPAGVRRADRSRRPSGRRRAQLVERLAAAAVSGHGHPPAGAADSESRSAGPPARRSGSSRTWRCWPTSTAGTSRGIRARPTWKPASPATSWPRGCRRPPRRRSTSRGETEATQKLYGLDEPATAEYGTRCLIARRLVERGVRFVQLFLGGQPWDNHSDIRETRCRASAGAPTSPAAALVQDLKARGLLDTTLVHWGGEIGRCR